MSLSAHPSVTLSVSRSRSKGRDALLISASDASDLGWYDLETDTGHPAGELFSLVIDAAGAGWRRGSGSTILGGASALVDVIRHDGAEEDRLLVYGYDGTDLGWYDLTTGLAHPASEIMHLAVQAAGLAFMVGRRSAPRRAGGESQLHVQRMQDELGDRLAVSGYDGTDLGWYDLTTGTSHPTSEIMQLVVEAAGLGWRAAEQAHQASQGPRETVRAGDLLRQHLTGMVSADPRWEHWATPVLDDAAAGLDAHLIIGPAGAFLACATGFSHSTDPSAPADGVSPTALQAALRLADQLAAHLSAAVRFPVPVPLVVASFGATVLPRPDGNQAISFLSGDCLPQWLRSRREVVDPSDLPVLVEHSRRIVAAAH